MSTNTTSPRRRGRIVEGNETTTIEPSQETTMTQTVVEDLTVEQAAPAEAPAETSTRTISAQAVEALKKYQEESKKAKAFLAEVLSGKHPDMIIPDAVLEAIRVIVPLRAAKGASSARSPKMQVLDKLLSLFNANGGKLSLMDIFKEFRMGEGEMRVRMRNAIHDRKPEERMWISYDPNTEVYTLEAVGADAPAGWTGPLPKEPKKN